MSTQPLVSQFAEAVQKVVEQFCNQGLTISEALGALDLVHGGILKDALEDEDDEGPRSPIR